MRVLLFEWLTGGGLLFEQQALTPAGSLHRQGNQMCQAIAADFVAAGCEVWVPVDFRQNLKLPGCRQVPVMAGDQLPLVLEQMSQQVDQLFLIAPESGKRLTRVACWVSSAAGKFLSPELPWLELCSDKTASCARLATAGVAVPQGCLWRSELDSWPPLISLPAVLKPNDGCGGEGLRLFTDTWGPPPDANGAHWRVEAWEAGEPLSVTALVGRNGYQLLQPTHQIFAAGNFGEYTGGNVVADQQLVTLARQAVEMALPALKGIGGMLGFDLVVDRSRERAVVIEVNPRLTSSYVGLRRE